MLWWEWIGKDEDKVVIGMILSSRTLKQIMLENHKNFLHFPPFNTQVKHK